MSSLRETRHFLFLVETPLVFAQETVTVSQPANLRANANRSSQIIQVLNPGDQITILESVSGNTVWLNGVESNVWYLMSGIGCS